MRLVCKSTAYHLTFLLVVIVAIFTEIQAEDERLSDKLIYTRNGPVQGVIKKSRDPTVEFVSFVGLRYASPPARFEPSQPLEATWTVPIIANTSGSICPQMVGPRKWEGNEDCLFLNIYVPSSRLERKQGNSTTGLPVLIWAHGGGYAFGDGYSYGADYFMETEDVILVTINYRLGLLGFITMETDTAFTANNGLRDVVTALKWIKDNIEAFNGDPSRVTIAGNSAGSTIVHYLLMSPLAKGLFHGAIMQSGAFSFWSYAQNPRKDALQLATAVLYPESEDPHVIRKCLEEKSVAELLIGQTTFSPRWPPSIEISRFLPTAKEPRENAFFVREPSSFFTFQKSTTKYVNNVPVMAGIVRDEGSTLFTSFVLSDEGYLSKLDSMWDRIAPRTFCYEGFFPLARLPWISRQLREYYFGKAPLTNSSLEFLTTLYTDSLFLLPVMYAAGDMAKSGLSVWPYVFTYLGEWSLRDGLGLPDVPGTVGHADELQYLFPHPQLGPPLKPDSDSEKFSKRLVKFWTIFVENGAPANEWFDGEPLNWKPISTSKSTNFPQFDALRLNSDPKVVKTFQFTDRLEFWRKTLREAWSVDKDKSGNGNKTEL